MSASIKSVTEIIAGLDLDLPVAAVLGQLRSDAREAVIAELAALATAAAIPALQADVERRLEELRSEAVGVRTRLRELETAQVTATADYHAAEAEQEDRRLARASDRSSTELKAAFEQAAARFRDAEAELERIRSEARALGRGGVGVLATLDAQIVRLETMQAYLADVQAPQMRLLPELLGQVAGLRG